ncbi:MAG: diacylglycerol kinase family protein [Planctomycetaceae bacterium]|nr:diacylglycerol kinase family protein [Planctomycetaceae bacterium]
MSKRFSFGNRIRSFGYAIRGVFVLIQTQHNAWIHVTATGLVILLGLIKVMTPSQWALLVLAIAIVWIAEALNTAVEILADVVSPEFNDAIGRCKDVAAGAVLMAAIAASVIGGLIFLT